MEEDVTPYQEHRDISWQKLLQRIRKMLKLMKKVLQRIRKILEDTARRCYNVPGTSWKLLQEDVTTCQEHLGS